MSEVKDYGEPWKAGWLTSFIVATGRPVKYIYRHEDESHETRIAVYGGEGKNGHEFDCDADAARIVACVNALAGMNPNAVRGLVEAVRDTLRNPTPNSVGTLRAALSALEGREG